ncbi:class I SAM-dependent methyltransferase [Streptomyces sp. NPDC014894]|uniref:class I SAM-dependent methyltransferase n=1 Tax=Streptomyces sp. NPDC014894 TaxID=3364931 RepID=UPI003701E955
MYGNDSSEVYDLLHRARGKDFEAEADEVARLIAARLPAASSLLDVACGTGAHLVRFAERYQHVAGLELSEPMLALARSRLPEVTFHQGDMRTFRLGRRFDAAVCLFGSIGYVDGPEGLSATLERFAEHLTPGGVLVVEPWWTPEAFTPGHVAADVVTVDGTRIARVSHASLDGTASLMNVHYVIAHEETGVRHFSEEHRCQLFTREQYDDAFTSAGFAVERLASPLSHRGLLVGVRK